MAHKLKGIRRKGKKWRVDVRVKGRLLTTTFDELDVPKMRAWQEQQRGTASAAEPGEGSFAADVATYLSRITAMPTYKQKAAHLALWLDALGRDRPSNSITAASIDAVLQHWMTTPSSPLPGMKGRSSGPDGLAPPTARKRRTALQSFFVALNGRQAPNPVKGSRNPAETKVEARALDYLTIRRILAVMPDQVCVKKGAPPRLALGKLRATVMAHTGLPPGILKTVLPHDLSLIGTGTVRVRPRRKGKGIEARTLQLTPDGLAAFRAFHAANAYGRFDTQKLNLSFQRAVKRIGLDPRTITLYDLRHSFGTEMYRVRGDLATVARFLLHSEGSPITARYAKAANDAVDTAAAAAFGASLAATAQHAIKTVPGHEAGKKLPKKLPEIDKPFVRKQLRRVV